MGTGPTPCQKGEAIGAWPNDVTWPDVLVQPEARGLRVARSTPTDERALELLLEGSPRSPAWAETYRQWRELGASIGATLIRAGENGQGSRGRTRAREGGSRPPRGA